MTSYSMFLMLTLLATGVNGGSKLGSQQCGSSLLKCLADYINKMAENLEDVKSFQMSMICDGLEEMCHCMLSGQCNVGLSAEKVLKIISLHPVIKLLDCPFANRYSDIDLELGDVYQKLFDAYLNKDDLLSKLKLQESLQTLLKYEMFKDKEKDSYEEDDDEL
ncbi:hypothetical protein Btru_052844 [Bulinus truncatus]|nr:hypothetical protein Btru_052844 [Bulinus truncatus]